MVFIRRMRKLCDIYIVDIDIIYAYKPEQTNTHN